MICTEERFRSVLLSTRMNTKKNIDNFAFKAIYGVPVVRLTFLTEEEIAQCKKGFYDDQVKENFSIKDTIKPNHESEPKLPKLSSKKRKIYNIKSQLMSTLKFKKNKESSCKSTVKKFNIESTKPNDENEPKIPKLSFRKKKIIKVESQFMSTLENEKSNLSSSEIADIKLTPLDLAAISYENLKYQLLLCEEKIDLVKSESKFTLRNPKYNSHSSEFADLNAAVYSVKQDYENGLEIPKSLLFWKENTDKVKSIKFTLKNQKNNSSSNEFANKEVTTKNTHVKSCNEIKTSLNLNSLKREIKFCDSRTATVESNEIKSNAIVSDKNSESSSIYMASPKNCHDSLISRVRGGNLFSYKIEILYNNYFTKSVQDTIVIVANIFYLISLCNGLYKAKLNESFKINNKAERFQLRYKTIKIHVRHKEVLELNLKNRLNEVILSFVVSEFELLFQIFFISILSVFKVQEQQTLNELDHLRNLVFLILNILRTINFENPKMYSTLKSESFYPDCIDLISFFEKSQNDNNNDFGIANRMALFFKSIVNSMECFQTVIYAITNDSVEDLQVLIDNAISQCNAQSKFNVSSNVKRPVKYDPSRAHQQRLISHDGNDGHDGNVQSLDFADQNEPKKNLESAVNNQPLNKVYKLFFNSLQTKAASESVSLEEKEPKKRSHYFIYYNQWCPNISTPTGNKYNSNTINFKF